MKFKQKHIEYYSWKAEIYAALMSGNIVNSNFHNRQQAIKEIQDLVAIANEEFIDKLLVNQNWRSKIIAGCLIGFKNKKSYIEIIGENLVRGCGGITGYCYALARFADDKSVSYLKRYLDQHLTFDNHPKEALQYWAFRALRWTDKVNNTNNCQSYLGEDGLWTQFVEFEFWTGLKLSKYKQWQWSDIEEFHLQELMAFYRDNFEINSDEKFD